MRPKADWRSAERRAAARELRRLGVERGKVEAAIARKTKKERERLRALAEEERRCEKRLRDAMPSDQENIAACLY